MKIESAEQVTDLLPPAPGLKREGRKRRQDAGKRPFVPCEECRGRGLVGSQRDGGQERECEACGGSGRAK